MLANNTINSDNVSALEQECSPLFSKLTQLQNEIRLKLSKYADGKTLKGNELVGWLGEIYGKLLFDGSLVSDQEEHDFICADGRRVSVKTRKGLGTGWQRTSAIPKIDGESCPTHLLFVHLFDDYAIDRIWFFHWSYLTKNERFKSHNVRGSHRSFIFTLDEKKDKAFIVYGKDNYACCTGGTTAKT
ncbi:hypothetical protein AGMMS50225_04400 [Betaproteobacteria bacterium]|nr:hypothetical protein AGMMS50225_04400 [Betaproteobacteria bacterium]